MPRTKQKRIKQSSHEYDQIIRDFNRLTQLNIHNLEMECKALEQKLETSMQLALSRYPPEIQKLTFDEIVAMDTSPKKENLPPQTPKIPKDSQKRSLKPPRSAKPKRVTTVSDDGYQSESALSQASKQTIMSRGRTSIQSQNNKKRKSRSVSKKRATKLSIVNTEKDTMKTPLNKPNNSFVITPKVKLNAAMKILRKPKDGEMVFSTQGSPLLVTTTINTDRTATFNVPLNNGNIVSVLPVAETSISDDIHLDEETKNQLKILQGHIEKFLK